MTPDGTLIRVIPHAHDSVNNSPTEDLGEIRTISSQRPIVNRHASVGYLAVVQYSFSSGECKSPCGSGPMLLTPAGGPRLCSPTSPCPRSHWCHVGITPEMTVCCPTGACSNVAFEHFLEPNTCELPLVKGHGSSYLTRWHFDNVSKKCVKFIYSGEGGNQVFSNCTMTKLGVEHVLDPRRLSIGLSSL